MAGPSPFTCTENIDITKFEPASNSLVCLLVQPGHQLSDGKAVGRLLLVSFFLMNRTLLASYTKCMTFFSSLKYVGFEANFVLMGAFVLFKFSAHRPKRV